MRPQIQLSFYIPETTPEDRAFPIRVAILKLIPPSKNSSLTFDVSLGLSRNNAGEVEGYAILLNGERVDPETLDTLPEATMRACLNFCQHVVPQWLHRHVREYATRAGVETAFLRRPAYGQMHEEYEEEHEFAADLPAQPDGDPLEVQEAEGTPEIDGRLGESGQGISR